MARRATAATVLAGVVLGGCGHSAAPGTPPELVLQDRAPYEHVAFSRDGRLLATVGENAPDALLFDAATGRLLRVLPPMNMLIVDRTPGWGTTNGSPSSAVGRAAVFSPDGRYVAAAPLSLKHVLNGGEWGGPAALWELSTGRPLIDTAWALVATVAHNPRIRWTGAEIAAWGAARDDEAAHRLARYFGPVRAISADGTIGIALEGARSTNTLVIRELPSGRERARLPTTFDAVWELALDPRGRWLAVRGSSPGVEIWDLRDLRRLAVLDFNARAIAFSPEGRYLAAADAATLRLYRGADWAVLFADSLGAEGDVGVSELAFAPDSRRLAVSRDSVLLVDVPSGRIAHVLPAHRVEPIRAWAAQETLLATARVMPDPYKSPSHLSSVEVWPLLAGAPRTLPDTLPTVVALALSPDGRALAAGILDEGLVSPHIRQGYRGGVIAWRLVDGRPLFESEDGLYQEQASDQVAFTADGRFLLATVYDPIVSQRDCPYYQCGEDEDTNYDIGLQRWELATGRSQRLPAVGFSPWQGRGKTPVISPTAGLVLVENGTSSQLISLATLRPIRGFPAAALLGGNHPYWSACLGRASDLEDDQRAQGFEVEFSPSGALLAVTDGAAVRVVRTATGELLARTDRVGGPETGITGLRFTPHSQALAVLTCDSASTRARLYRLDLAGGGGLRPLFQLAGSVEDILFALNGRILARVGDHVDLYDAAGVHLATLLRATDDEWAVTTPHGLYDASAHGADLVAWRAGGRVVSAGELPAEFHVPGLLGKLMRGEALPAPGWPRALR